ncbi:DNA helicase [Paraburkholderia sabiae]|uniref:UvrD-helicase domain-containing protein n=1 Tax=Paraburkholderia sabiae TaxID=273251 RepID=UPI001CAB311D|nr:UvrD-helicase domain-containing protein [Paraburkholderia sabiae]CAG9228589.1 DNA helicase [Paraburkholderia sabiae]
MGKTVIFAVAGSGKTYRIVERLDEIRRVLIVTYTEANRENLRTRIIQKFGHFPANIVLYTYFTFLHSFCYRPFLLSEKQTKGVTFERPLEKRLQFSLDDDLRYMTKGRWLYHHRLAKYVEQTDTVKDVVARIEKYFDAFFVDEVQDFAGHDFNLLMSLCRSEVECMFVGDFFQHTYDTSRDGTVNVNLHADYEKYKARFKAASMDLDLASLIKSRRCSKSVCDFITKQIGIQIESHSDALTEVNLIEDYAVAQELYQSPEIVKLFLQEHYKYGCYSQNWGASKGLDHYEDVCVVLHQAALDAWKAGALATLNPETRNKLYVACSRARGNLTFVPDGLFKQHKRKRVK